MLLGDVYALVESLNISTTDTRTSTKATEENTKAKEDNFDVEEGLINLLMTRGVTTKEEEARITEHLNELREKEILLQLKEMDTMVGNFAVKKHYYLN